MLIFTSSSENHLLIHNPQCTFTIDRYGTWLNAL